MKELLSLVILTGLTLNLLGQSERPAKPNVVLMLVDDLGWQDVICYDVDEPAPYETPNLDKLAQRGVLFTNGYSPAPVCSVPALIAITSAHARPALINRAAAPKESRAALFVCLHITGPPIHSWWMKNQTLCPRAQQRRASPPSRPRS